MAHWCRQLKIMARMILLFTPAYTPELSSSERMWSFKEAVINEAHETLNALEDNVCSRHQNISRGEVSAKRNQH